MYTVAMPADVKWPASRVLAHIIARIDQRIDVLNRASHGDGYTMVKHELQVVRHLLVRAKNYLR